MRIAIFSDTFHPEINGVVTSIETFRRELIREGHDVYVFAPRYFGRKEHDPHVVRFPSIPYPFPMMHDQRISFPGNGGLRRFGRLKFDIIHSQVPAFNGILALIASWRWRVPHVHTYHTHYMEYVHYAPFPFSFARRAVVWIATRFTGRCQRVIAPSRGMKDVLESYGVKPPIEVIPTGIRLEDMPRDVDLQTLFARHGLGDVGRLAGRRLLVTVGRLGPEKNTKFLVRALADLKRRGERVHLIMIGGGPDRAGIEQEIRRNDVEDFVTITGYVPRADVLAFLRCCELFVFASKTETQGLVMLEAMATGTPVVAIRATGVDDLITDGIGGIATQDDQAEFVGAVQQLLHDPDLLAEKRRKALARADEWRVEHSATRLIELYEDAIRDFRAHGLPRWHHRPRW